MKKKQSTRRVDSLGGLMVESAVKNFAAGDKAKFGRILARDRRTVERWIALKSPVPLTVREWIQRRNKGEPD